MSWTSLAKAPKLWCIFLAGLAGAIFFLVVTALVVAVVIRELPPKDTNLFNSKILRPERWILNVSIVNDGSLFSLQHP